MSSRFMNYSPPIFLMLILHQTSLWLENVHAQTKSGVWKAGKWGPCSGACGAGGSQLRSVFCEDLKQGYQTLNKHCPQGYKPKDQRDCFKVCDHHKSQYQWRFSDWQACRYLEVSTEKRDFINCGRRSNILGHRFRTATCVSVSNDSYIVDNYVCERLFTNQPTTQEECRVPCLTDCVTSSYGTWSSCSNSCGNGTQVRVRQVLRNSKYGGAPCPQLTETRHCQDDSACGNEDMNINHIFKFEDFTSCSQTSIRVPIHKRTGKNNNRKPKISERLIGAKKRKVKCLTASGLVISESEAIVETCALNQPCSVLPWSKWSICNATCGRNGIQERTRKIRKLPLGDNASLCPNLLGRRSCLIDLQASRACSSYGWMLGEWSSCKLIHNVSCGGGLQQRDVYCVQRDSFTTTQASKSFRRDAWKLMEPIDYKYCNLSAKPNEWKMCNVPCKHKCDLGQWSDWSECALPTCPGDSASSAAMVPRKNAQSINKVRGFKRRVRSVYMDYRYPEDCKHTIEVVPCDQASCFFWHVSSRSLCQAGHGECGPGFITQTLECRDMWDNMVENQMCTDHPFTSSMSPLLPCHVPCREDCVVGEWSVWSPCTRTCRRGNGQPKYQTRQRRILAKPGPLGSRCPDLEELSESRLCNQHKCSVYYWKSSKWDLCKMKDSTPPPRSRLESPEMLFNENETALNLAFLQHKKAGVCGPGYQTRRVFCQKKGSNRVGKKMCLKWVKPIVSRPCVIACNKDCVLSQWSQWSDCQEECSKLIKRSQNVFQNADDVLAGLANMYQHRKRYIIQPRIGTGQSCERETEQSRLCSDLNQCFMYSWRSGEWSPCLLAKGTSTIYEGSNKCRGVKTRTITCYRRSLITRKRSKLSNCMENAGLIPHATRPCEASCPPNFAFNKWLKRSGCMASTADITTLAVHDSTVYDDTRLETTYSSQQMIARPIGPWSSCFVDYADLRQEMLDDCPVTETDQDVETRSAVFTERVYCGRGRKKRALGCFEENTQTMRDISFCSYRAFDEEDCEIVCPVDCEMSPWTRWGTCGNLMEGQVSTGKNAPNPPCGENRQIRFKYFLEDRKAGGRTCPVRDSLDQVYKSRPCYIECKENFWLASGWNTCKLENITTERFCGAGTQSQTVECYNTSGYGNIARREGDRHLCFARNKPDPSRSCSLPCPRECVLSDWSSWESCKQTSGNLSGKTGTCENATRKRTRYILRQADATSAKADICDNLSLEEAEVCRLNKNCHTFSWMWVAWSSCLLSDRAVCGPGYKKRRANCVRSDGLPVHVSRCKSNKLTMPNPDCIDCIVECPIDCLVGAWSAWTRCSATCGISRFRTRTRKVLREASAIGRRCPDELIQNRPCCIKPCHQWVLAGWKDCAISDGNCGEGIQERIVTCRQQDGVEVDARFCKVHQRKQGNGQLYDWFTESQLSRTCHVPCPGECRMNSWSSWSKCHSDCEDEFLIETYVNGTQTRSRVRDAIDNIITIDCPAYEVEEINCTKATCFNYVWKTGPYVGDKRYVWCERQEDHLVVSSGCPLALKPPTACQMACSQVEYSYCTDVGLCECTPPYKTVRQSNLTLCLDLERVETPRNVSPHYSVKGNKDILDLVEATLTERTTFVTSFVKIPVDTSDGNWRLFYPIKPDGTLKVWAYGALAGLVVLLVFIIALTYLVCSACRRSSRLKSTDYKHRKRHRRHNSSGSNVGVGMVVSNGGGSSVYGTGGNGLPPYYMSAPTFQFTPVRGLSRTPSARSGLSFLDRYDSDD